MPANENEPSPVVHAPPAVETGRRGSAAEPASSRQFARGIWRLAGANVTARNRVRLLHDGPETFEAMVQAIEEARDRVALEINYELDAIIEDVELGRDADAMFLADLERSAEITPSSSASP